MSLKANRFPLLKQSFCIPGDEATLRVLFGWYILNLDRGFRLRRLGLLFFGFHSFEISNYVGRPEHRAVLTT